TPQRAANTKRPLRRIGTLILDPQGADVEDEPADVDTGRGSADVELHELDTPTRVGRKMDQRAGDIDVAAPPSAADDDTQILSVPVGLRRSGREITMRIDRTDPFATVKPDARLVKLLRKARRFNAALLDTDGVPYKTLANREGVSASYFTRLVRLSF